MKKFLLDIFDEKEWEEFKKEKVGKGKKYPNLNEGINDLIKGANKNES